MSNLITQNYYTTQTVTEVQASVTGEISIQLLSAPIWEFWILLFGEDDNMEEIFFHRRSWNTIYTYAINRSNPKTHPVWTNVVMNDSAWIFNYLSKNVYNHFYCYKESNTSVFVFGWLIFKEWIIEIPNKSLTISEWMNYIYLDDNFEIQISSSYTNKYTVWLVTKSWSLISITKYNVLWFGKDWKDGVDWTNGTNGTDWIDGKSIVSAWFNWNDIDFTMNDSSVVKLHNAKIDLKWDPGDILEPWTDWQHISDIMKTNTSTNTVTTDGSTFVKITENATWNYVLYNLTGRKWASSSDEVSNHEVVTWTWWVIWLLEWITYTDWLTIDTDWTVRYTGQPAYRDKENEFIWVNTLNNATIFKWNVSFPYYRIDMTWKTEIKFDSLKWTKQRTINLTTTWSKTLSFDNLVAWANYELAIVNNSSWNITLGKWTISNSDTITKFYSLWWTTYPLTLSTWVHLFVMDTFDTAVHISYVWQSVEI